ncbi:MAG: hypothetical protein FJX29_11380, partial [Alphaproteobacteria bacterium]|nr:hypothetical protein [Alphaproteobacteria bacterium]
FSLLVLFPVFALIYLASTAVLLMRDDMLSALMKRQGAMQAAYEERIADMRAQIDLVTSRQLLDQNSLEARIHEMLSRQAQLENRAAVISALAQGAGVAPQPGSAKNRPANGSTVPVPVPRPQQVTRSGRQAQIAPQAQPRQIDETPVGSIAYAPRQPSTVEAHAAFGFLKRPQSQGNASTNVDAPAFAADRSLPASTRVGALMRSLERIEIEQIASINRIGAAARAREERLRRIIAATGLSPDRLKVPSSTEAVGGVFVPFKLDPNGSVFEREVLRFQDSVTAADRLGRVVLALPVGRPLPPSAAITSSFGSRIDPFNGRLASHTGIDFREATGAPVYASGAGQFVTAAYTGGYGNMVEIDHGNGVTSRYAHLSALTVREGQKVRSGAMIGRVGSTGRSTGPHLHYEVRFNDQPLDPRRFLALREKVAIR